uniref:OTU domain-containing protein n=1 Tax=viral metagenome TaxID=1070528 RepID=A0A6C0CGG9_9ZZZZ
MAEQASRLEWVAQHSAAAAQSSGFMLGKTPGNGNCLFGAVASALAGSDLPSAERERQEADLRARAVAYIADPQNIETFRGVEVEPEGITGYVQKMSQDGEYGGDFEIAALEGVLGRCINVWQPRTGGTDLEPARETPRTGCLNLFFNGINHFDPLYGSGPAVGGKRKWPFYGRRTTQRQSGGEVTPEQKQKLIELYELFKQVVGDKKFITDDEYILLDNKRQELGLSLKVLSHLMKSKQVKVRNKQPDPEKDNPFTNADDTVRASPEKVAEKIFTENARVQADIDADAKYKKDLKTFQSAQPKWAKYKAELDTWTKARAVFDTCYMKYRAVRDKWLQERQDWADKLIKVAEALSSDQILRLQSRGVGSSLMLDEARKLMIDADAQQRIVMESKTDLQFTLASSSDADIAKAVGFYEAELQKLKTCISKGKEDAIAEYDKDLAEIEKRKRDITAKTFEVKAPQENQQQQGNTYYLKSMTKTQLTAEITKLNLEKAGIKPNPGQNTLSGKQNKRIASIDTKIKFANTRLNDSTTPAGGNRRMTMRRRRV